MRVITSKDVPAYKPLNTKAGEVIITTELVDKVNVVDSKKGTFTTSSEVVETSRIDTQEYIDSFKNDVGIENILKKFELVKDPALFNQVSRPTAPLDEDGKEIIQDYTNILTENDAINLAQRARVEFESLPKELVKGRSFTDFAESCTKEELLAFINSQNVKEKEGEK